LILGKIIKIVATRCHILRLKIHQIRFRLGIRPCEAVLFLTEGREGKEGEEEEMGKERGGTEGKVASWLLGEGGRP